MIHIYPLATDTAGCWYQRLHLPLTHLDPNEFEVHWNPPAVYEPGSVIVAQRFAGDNPAWRDLCARDDLLCVYDLDDDLVDLDYDNTIPYTLYHPQREGTIANITAAHVVTVATPRLAIKVRRWNPRVVVLPNCIHPDRLTVPRPPRISITVGWAGSMFHQQDFTPAVVAALQRVRQARPQVQWASIGADYLAGIPNTHYPWGTIERYHQALFALDIGIAPLNPTPFNDGKSWIKCLDYQAAGVVPVAPWWGQYPQLIWHGVNGYLGIDESDMAIHLLELTADRNQLDEMSVKARENAAEWTIDKHIEDWANVYRGKQVSDAA